MVAAWAKLHCLYAKACLSCSHLKSRVPSRVVWDDVGVARQQITEGYNRVDVGRCGITLPGIHRAAWLLRRKRPGTLGLTGGHLARFTPRRVAVAEKRSGTLGGGLSVAAVRGEAAPGPQARITAPYRPRCSLDQRTAGRYLGGLGTPGDGCLLLGLVDVGRCGRWVGCGATLTDVGRVYS